MFDLLKYAITAGVSASTFHRQTVHDGRSLQEPDLKYRGYLGIIALSLAREVSATQLIVCEYRCSNCHEPVVVAACVRL